jgi:hypothetical protein
MPEIYTIVTAAGGINADLEVQGNLQFRNMVQVQDSPVIGRAIESYVVDTTKLVVAIRECETESTGVWVKESFPQSSLHSVPGNGYQGALVSAIVAAGALPGTSELVICAGDSEVEGGVHEELLSFSNRGVDGGVVCFESSKPRWSYAKLQANKLDVLEISEKKVISNFATVGCFYFSSVDKFLEAAEWCLVKNASTNGYFFTSMALNHLVASGKKVESRVVDANRYKPYASPQDFLQ